MILDNSSTGLPSIVSIQLSRMISTIPGFIKGHSPTNVMFLSQALPSGHTPGRYFPA
jgi:hypothetical protein